MKMIYRARDNQRKRKKTAVMVGAVGIVLCAVLVLGVANPTFFSPLVHAVGRPLYFFRTGQLGGIGSVRDFLASKAALVRENNVLREELSRSRVIQTERDFYLFEVQKLSGLLHRVSKPSEFVVGRILAKPGFSPYDTMVVDVGESDGVVLGASVLADEHTVLGTVGAVYGHSSVVTLFSTPGREVSVLIGSSSVQTVATGLGGGNFEVKLPRNAGVKSGDPVVMASSTARIVGVIEHAAASPTDSFERLLLTNSVDINYLSHVLIEKP